MIIKVSHQGAAVASIVALVLSVASFSVGAPVAMAAQSEIFDLDPSLQSRIAREKIKQRGPRRGSRAAGGSGNSDSDNCGQVDIGNNNSSDNTARGRLNPRNNTVIVTGPVINAARCR